jgi:hypothetical protein
MEFSGDKSSLIKVFQRCQASVILVHTIPEALVWISAEGQMVSGLSKNMGHFIS